MAGDSAHIGSMTTPHASTFAFDLHPKSNRPSIQFHRISWFLDGDVSFELECLHEPFDNERFVCDAECAREDTSVFPEYFAGPKRTPLRDGIIRSWWDGDEEEAELWWRYATRDEIKALPASAPTQIAPIQSRVAHVVSGVFGTIIAPDPTRPSRYLIAWEGGLDGDADSHHEGDFIRVES